MELPSKALTNIISGAACEAAKEGVPSIAFSGSGSSVAQEAFTDLIEKPAPATIVAVHVYTQLVLKVFKAVLPAPFLFIFPPLQPILPAGITLNVNFPTTNATTCSSPDDFKFVLTRILVDTTAKDVVTCGSDQLPDETTVVGLDGCFASISVFNATDKADVNADIQGFVLNRIRPILSCVNGGRV